MKHETFTDPETGREIESTWLAKAAGVAVAMIIIMAVTTWEGVLIWEIALGQIPDNICPLLLLLVFAFCACMFALLPRAFKDNHDTVARWQDRRREARRQKRLLWRVTRHIPDGALSRAQPPGEPQATAASLSRADAPEERKPLMVSAVEEAETYETVTVSA